MTTSIDPAGQDLIEEFYALAQRITAHQFPAVTEGETTDDGETFKVLRCPHCEAILSEGETLVAVDWSTRWTYAEPVYDTDFDHRSIEFSYDDAGEFDGLHYMCEGCGNAVSLPEGWSESA